MGSNFMPITADFLYKKLSKISLATHHCQFNKKKCENLVPIINKINDLKKRKKAVILAHSYVAPEIIYGVADFVGDSYGLSKNALQTDADIIVFAAVKFMGETAKLLNPNKEVLIPSELNGCSLADSIDAQDIQELKKKFPDYTFVCYINTTAEVKAECDVCVTSSNVYKIIKRIENDKIFFLPDKLMGQNLINYCQQNHIKKVIQLWDGTCYVHEEYRVEIIEFLKDKHQELKVLAHPECSSEVLEHSDFVGSTSELLQYIKGQQNNKFLMLTECGLSSRVQVEMPEKNFVGTCSMCRYMKSNKLEDILRVLENPEEKDFVRINPKIIDKANLCLEKMFFYAEKEA